MVISIHKGDFMEIKIVMTDKNNQDFIALTQLLDKELHSIHGEHQNHYDKFNTLEHISDAVVLYDGKIPVACGALREYDKTTVEIKRVYVIPEYRRLKLGYKIMTILEDTGRAKGYTLAILETSDKLVAALKLYKELGYVESKNMRSGECGLWMKKSFDIISYKILPH